MTAYALLLPFCSLSLSRTSCSTCTSLSSGSLVRIFSPKSISAGLASVLLLSEVGFFALQDKHSALPSSLFFSACVIWSLFRSELFWRSTSPFAWGYFAVTPWCLIPCCSMYPVNSVDTKCGALSYVRLSGRPCLANISSRLEMRL